MATVAPAKARAARVGDRVLYELRPSAAAAAGPNGGRDIVLIIDTSYSMQSAANQEGEGAMKLFSKLDIVKHAAAAVVDSLSGGDRVGVVAYDSSPRVACALRAADAAGKAAALAAVKGLRENGATNIWQALDMSLELLLEPPDRGEPAERAERYDMLLLTDGHPTESPAMGEAAWLKKRLQAPKAANATDADVEVYKERVSRLSLSTFGMGYDIASGMLLKLAEVGGGSFNFIPDGSMVGTVMINALAAGGAATAGPVRLRLSGGGARALGGLSQAKANAAMDEVVITLGDLRRGQTRNVLVELAPGGAMPRATLLLPGETWPLESLESWEDEEEGKEEDEEDEELDDAARVAAQEARCHFLAAMDEVVNKAGLDLGIARADAAAAASAVAALHAKAPVLLDLRGQIAEALSRREWWLKWGQHYIPSLLGAHRDERANNFKDLGVQSYASPHFLACRDALDAAFNQLEPPTPSMAAVGVPADGSAPPVLVARADFTDAWNNRSNGCFAPWARVAMADGVTFKRADELKKGDLVRSPRAAGGVAAVRCVTRHEAEAGSGHALCQLPHGGPALTPWHPVVANGSWAFPAWLVAPVSDPATRYVYNFVLQEAAAEPAAADAASIATAPSLLVDGYEAVALAHDLTEDVARHPYFGTAAVLRDLATLPGWADGLVDVAAAQLQRDARTGRVCGSRQHAPCAPATTSSLAQAAARTALTELSLKRRSQRA